MKDPGVADAALDSIAPVVVDAVVDAVDAQVAPPIIVAPVLDATGVNRFANTSTAIISMNLPEGADRFLLISVGIGSACGDPSVAAVSSVAYGGIALTRVASVTGTPCAVNATRSEQWQLVAPATGAHDVVVTLSAPALTVHVGGLGFTGVDQTTPVRASATGHGADAAASVAVTSAVNDLVVSTVGHGYAVTAPGTGQTPAYIFNATGVNTLDNSAAATAPGAAPVVAMDWTFPLSDQWQMIVSSLQPVVP